MASVKKSLALISFYFGIAIAPATAQNQIDMLLEVGVADGRIPGVIAAAANSDGIFYHAAVGMSELSSNTKMTNETIVRIASMTKPITSVAIMQLVEQGMIGLDDPVGDYLPPTTGTQVLEGFDEHGKPLLRAASLPVTIRQLLTHTSGFAYTIWNDNIKRFVEVEPTAGEPGGLMNMPLVFDPGTKWEYGISTDILGILIETVSEQTLDEYFRDHIFTPLGMSDTYFIVPDAKLPRLATTYSRSDDGNLEPMPYSRPSGHFFSGGGGLRSTADDYIRFLRAFLNDGKLDGARILSAKSIDLMAQNHIGELEAAYMLKTAIPNLSNDFEFMPESVDKFGLGFLINNDPVSGGRSAGSLAWAGLFNTYFWIDRERDICGVLLTQILPFFDADVLMLQEQFEAAVYSSLPDSQN